MNLFGWRKSVSISEQDPTFKVRYLGNVQTTLMKGEGCVDRPTSVIWSNYLRSENRGVEMTVVVTGSGMKAYTKQQGLTEYRAHRISYCIAHPGYPRLFVWVYRHEGRKMKMELRCHALMCKNEAKAKTLALQLHQKLSFALREFQREKLRKQNSRLTLQRTNTMSPSGHVLPLRAQLLSTAKNFRPPVSKSQTAPKLHAIIEDDECLEVDEEEMITMMSNHKLKRRSVGARLEGNNNNNCDMMNSTRSTSGPCSSGLVHDGAEHHDILEALDLESADGFDKEYLNSDLIIDLEIGNDLNELEHDDQVKFCLLNSADSDEESAESGYHDLDPETVEIEKEKARSKEPLTVDDEEYASSVCHLPAYDLECNQENSVDKTASL